MGHGQGLGLRRHDRARSLERQRPDARHPAVRRLAARADGRRAGPGRRSCSRPSTPTTAPSRTGKSRHATPPGTETLHDDGCQDCVAGLSLGHGSGRPGAAAPAATGGLPGLRGEKDDARRLACFDAAVVRAGKQAADPARNRGAGPPSRSPLSKEEKFGLRGDLKQEKAKVAPELAETRGTPGPGHQSRGETPWRAGADPRQWPGLVRNPDQFGYPGQGGRPGHHQGRAPWARSRLVAPNGRSSKVTRSR